MLTETQYQKLAPHLPKQRGNVKLDNRQVLNAILYMVEQGCKWRALPKEFGHWHTVYTRMLRWSRKGVLTRLFEEMQMQRLIAVKITTVCLDSTSVKVHPDAAGTLKKTALNPSANRAADETPKFIWSPRMIERP